MALVEFRNVVALTLIAAILSSSAHPLFANQAQRRAEIFQSYSIDKKILVVENLRQQLSQYKTELESLEKQIDRDKRTAQVIEVGSAILSVAAAATSLVMLGKSAAGFVGGAVGAAAIDKVGGGLQGFFEGEVDFDASRTEDLARLINRADAELRIFQEALEQDQIPLTPAPPTIIISDTRDRLPPTIERQLHLHDESTLPEFKNFLDHEKEAWFESLDEVEKREVLKYLEEETAVLHHALVHNDTERLKLITLNMANSSLMVSMAAASVEWFKNLHAIEDEKAAIALRSMLREKKVKRFFEGGRTVAKRTFYEGAKGPGWLIAGGMLVTVALYYFTKPIIKEKEAERVELEKRFSLLLRRLYLFKINHALINP